MPQSLSQKTVLMVAGTASMIGQFNMNNIRLLLSMGYKVDVACNFLAGNTCPVEETEAFKTLLTSLGVDCHQVDFTRCVTNLKGIYDSYKQILKLLKEKQYTFIHCHMPIVSVLVREACTKYNLWALKNGLKPIKVIYTAHGFHFFKGAPLKNWLIYYPVEKYYSRYTDILITINHEDYERAMKKFHAKKVEYVPGVGVDTQKFSSSLFTEEEKTAVRSELGIGKNSVWLLSVGELNENKNHATVIKALGAIHSKHPELDFYYTVAGVGNKKEELELLAKKLGICGRVKLLGFRSDVSKLCEAADIFVMPSHREGLSVALMEAMASGLPCAVSRIRGNTDLIDGNGGRLFDSHSVKECENALLKICEMTGEERAAFGLYNRNKMKPFDKEAVAKSMGKVYSVVDSNTTYTNTKGDGISN